jgi:hypothetical protein
MSTLDAKTIKKGKPLNTKLLPIAALVLLVLALVFMATPLLRVTGVTGAGRTFNGSGFTPGQGFTPNQRTNQNGQGTVFQGPGSGGSTDGTQPGTTTGQPFVRRGGSGLLGFGLLSGMTGTIVYAIALLVSLAAAIGMFITKKWGQVLGIVMAVLYLILGLVSLLPTLLLSFIGGFNGLSLGLSLLHLVLAIAVIVLASIPGKTVATIPSAPAGTVPPAVSA